MAAEKIEALELDISSKASTENIDKLIEALGRLSTALGKIQSKSVTVDVKQTGDAAKDASGSVDKLSGSFLNQAVKITAVIALFKKLTSTISTAVANSMNYVKTLNMFSVSLGEYADNATKYGETVRDALGIDIAGWQSAQGIFQTLITGFGVTGDKAAYMSQNITQLSYDIASFYGITNEEAANKLKSALSGRLEPIRKLGYDLSQAKLVDIAKNPANYGKQTFSINEQTGAIEANTVAVDDNTRHKIVNFNQLTQQEKVQLRYIALMTQVTQVQGNYARALNDPANQMKVFKDQVNMTSRALGNIFIPILNKVLPYLTAFAQLAQQAFQSLANLMGFQLPDMKERMGDKNIAKPYNDVVKATGKAAKNAKKIKDYTLGIDELNVLRPDDGLGAGGGSGIGGQNSNLKNLKLPGYDFLSKAVENSIKKAKETIQKLFADLKKNPFLLNDIIKWGAGELGSKIWEKILGKTPEQLKADAAAHGRTIGEEFIVQLSDKIKGGIGQFQIDFWTAILGKTPEELAQEANQNGTTVGEEFYKAIEAKVNERSSNLGEAGSWIMSKIFGSPDDLGKRAAEAGRTVWEQFSLEIYRGTLKMFENPVMKFFYEKLSGRSLDADIKKVEALLKPKGGQNSFNRQYQYVSAEQAKSIAPKQVVTAQVKFDMGEEFTYMDKTGKVLGKKFDDSFASGVEENKATVKRATGDAFKASVSGLTQDGTANTQYAYISADQAKAYYMNLATKDSKAKTYNAASSLSSQGVAGAKSNNGGYTTAGTQAGAGYIGGINSDANIKKYKKAGGIVGLNSLNELRKTLGIHSPSTKFAALGDYSAEGYAKGLTDNAYLATDAVKAMATSALTALGNASDISNGIILNGNIADPTSRRSVSIPANSGIGYGVGMANGSAMATLASNIYQAVVSGMTVVADSIENKETNVIIDGKEVFKAVQTEGRKRGVAISNGAFSR